MSKNMINLLEPSWKWLDQTRWKKKDLQAFHDNSTCSPNKVGWTTHQKWNWAYMQHLKQHTIYIRIWKHNITKLCKNVNKINGIQSTPSELLHSAKIWAWHNISRFIGLTCHINRAGTELSRFNYVNIIAAMSWLLASPGHQQLWYWLCRMGRSLSYLRKDFNHLCHINVEEWHEM